MKREKFLVLCLFLAAMLPATASWYWPFGDDDDEVDQPRLSELMEPATTNIDAAADFAAEGKYKEAQECYRKAIAALSRIEAENPERAATPEFATVRNKRAYINAALDSMLLAEAHENAKAVAVTDTTSLEVELALKPWSEFQTRFAALTNVDRLVSRRVQALSPSNRVAVASELAAYEATRTELMSCEAAATRLISQMKHLATKANTLEGGRVFDVCRSDAKRAIAACTTAWPKHSEAVTRLAPLLGEDDLEVPVEEAKDDRGLVTDDGDKRPEVTRQLDDYVSHEREHTEKVNRKAEQVKYRKGIQREVKRLMKEDPTSRKARMLTAGEHVRNGDLAAAKAVIAGLLEEKPNDGPALNMRAAIEAAEGNLKAAENTLDQAIQSNPRDYHAYYNMANVFLQQDRVDGARRYYETGRSLAGPKNEELEKAFKQ